MKKRDGVRVNPKKGVIITRPGERALGRMMHIETGGVEPKDVTQRDLLADVFFSLWKHDPHTRKEVPDERKINKLLMDWMLTNDQISASRHQTNANLVASAISAGLMWNTLVTDETLKEILEEQRKAEEEARKAQQKMQEAADAAAKGDTQKHAELMAQVQAMQQQIKAHVDQATAKLQQTQKSLMGQGMVQSMGKSAAKAAGEANTMMAGWGIDPGSVQPTDLPTIMNLLRGSEQTLKEIAKIVGRLKSIAKFQFEQARKNYTGQVTEVAFTRDLTRIFPSERISLSSHAPPYLRTMTVLRFVQRGLLGWVEKSRGESQGAFVAMVDGSGSMRGMEEVMAKSIAIGIGKALMDENQDSTVKRRYELYTFGTSRDPVEYVTSDQDWRDHIAWASRMPGGGTDFNFALQVAINKLKEMGKKVKGADLLFITDGFASISDEVEYAWREHREASGARMIYIQIGGGLNDAVEELADLTIETGVKLDADKLTLQISDFIANHQYNSGVGD